MFLKIHPTFIRMYALIVVLLTGNVSFGVESVEKSFPLTCSVTKGSQKALILYITGDGGLNTFNKSLIHAFEEKQYGVVTLNSRKYFWNQKNPEIFAKDIEQIALQYMKVWDKSSLIIIGYSFGADVAAFLPNRISKILLSKIKTMVLLSPSSSTDFVIHVTDLMATSDNAGRKYKIESAITSSSVPTFVLFGKEESLLLKNKLKDGSNVTVFDLPGNHQYQQNYSLLVQKMRL